MTRVFAALVTLPLVDLAPFLYVAAHDDAARAVSAAALLSAFGSLGMAAIVGHGVANETIGACREVFAAPRAAKLESASRSGVARGFIGFGGESGSEAVEPKEGFAFGAADNRDENALRRANVWDTAVAAETRCALDAAFEALNDAALALVAAMRFGDARLAEALDACCDRDARQISLARLFHYFAVADAAADDDDPVLGSSAHSDWGLLTLIVADDAAAQDGGELEVWHEAAWKRVRAPRADALVANAGDFLSLASRRALLSPRHRVRAPKDASRTSLVFFFYPDYDARAPRDDKDEARGGSLSLLACQLPGAVCAAETPSELRFGDLIARKWAEVTREPTGPSPVAAERRGDL